jgi:nitrogen regulatory protein P-II 1
MKQITAIIRPHRLDAVEAALEALPHLPGFTVSAANGHPRGHGPDHRFAADEWNPHAHEMSIILVWCADADAEAIVAAIAGAARTGQPGDGMIGVAELATAVRIRTGERDAAAL